jgi:bifunctional DNA-binding transcriptional regulator/antitoxin component of YhaV-PrlF toxin-antitoxin module
MATTRLREKSQMTVPTEVARQLGLQPDELLDIRIVGDAVVVCPQRATRPNQHHPMHFWGAGRGARTTEAKEIDQHIHALRDEWEPPA